MTAVSTVPSGANVARISTTRSSDPLVPASKNQALSICDLIESFSLLVICGDWSSLTEGAGCVLSGCGGCSVSGAGCFIFSTFFSRELKSCCCGWTGFGGFGLLGCGGRSLGTGGASSFASCGGGG